MHLFALLLASLGILASAFDASACTGKFEPEHQPPLYEGTFGTVQFGDFLTAREIGKPFCLNIDFEKADEAKIRTALHQGNEEIWLLSTTSEHERTKKENPEFCEGKWKEQACHTVGGAIEVRFYLKNAGLELDSRAHRYFEIETIVGPQQGMMSYSLISREY